MFGPTHRVGFYKISVNDPASGQPRGRNWQIFKNSSPSDSL